LKEPKSVYPSGLQSVSYLVLVYWVAHCVKMSRCFPYPPPGFEPSLTNRHADLLHKVETKLPFSSSQIQKLLFSSTSKKIRCFVVLC
jgi:hypothetical protein